MQPESLRHPNPVNTLALLVHTIHCANMRPVLLDELNPSRLLLPEFQVAINAGGDDEVRGGDLVGDIGSSSRNVTQ